MNTQIQDNPFNFLANVSPSEFVEYMGDTKIEVIAAVLSFTDSNYISEVLSSLDDRIKVKLVISLATLDIVNPFVAKTLAKKLKEKFKDATEDNNFESNNDTTIRTVAKALNVMGYKASEIIYYINNLEPKVSRDIKENMFIFEDVLTLDENDLKKVLKEIGIKLFYIATVDDNKLREKVDNLNNLLDLNYEYTITTTQNEINSAKQTIYEKALTLIEHGEIKTF